MCSSLKKQSKIYEIRILILVPYILYFENVVWTAKTLKSRRSLFCWLRCSAHAESRLVHSVGVSLSTDKYGTGPWYGLKLFCIITLDQILVQKFNDFGVKMNEELHDVTCLPSKLCGNLHNNGSNLKKK